MEQESAEGLINEFIDIIPDNTVVIDDRGIPYRAKDRILSILKSCSGISHRMALFKKSPEKIFSVSLSKFEDIEFNSAYKSLLLMRVLHYYGEDPFKLIPSNLYINNAQVNWHDVRFHLSQYPILYMLKHVCQEEWITPQQIPIKCTMTRITKRRTLYLSTFSSDLVSAIISNNSYVVGNIKYKISEKNDQRIIDAINDNKFLYTSFIHMDPSYDVLVDIDYVEEYEESDPRRIPDIDVISKPIVISTQTSTKTIFKNIKDVPNEVASPIINEMYNDVTLQNTCIANATTVVDLVKIIHKRSGTDGLLKLVNMFYELCINYSVNIKASRHHRLATCAFILLNLD